MITHQDGTKRLVGLEVEFNSVRNWGPIREWCQKWRADTHHDGSCGYEAVTAPASGILLKSQLQELTNAFDLAKVSQDKRCGVHVHVDARDLSEQHVRRLSILYGRVENAMYAISGNRIRSQWCHKNGRLLSMAARSASWKTHSRLIRNIYREDGYTPDSVDVHYSGKKCRARYVGMNLVPWSFGKVIGREDTTVEFRMHKASKDLRTLIRWANICSSVVDTSVDLSIREISTLPKLSHKALYEVVPRQYKAWLAMQFKKKETIECAA